MKKHELLDLMKAADDKLERLFSQIPASFIERPGVYGELSPKDVLAHIAAWQQLETNWLRDSLWGRGAVRFAPGFEVSLDTPEDEVEGVQNRLNEYVFEQNKDRPFAEVLGDYRRTYRELTSTIEQMSDEDLNDPKRFEWWRGEPVWSSIAGNSYAHVEEHLVVLSDWLRSTAE
ncbi:MAG TPA: ClbS/DfsB family four-helix bundle protein [Chloroflexia bacterium]|nr:ClbS/DfsB family four-helix bundle protein [Chloroflexia bacterium]